MNGLDILYHAALYKYTQYTIIIPLCDETRSQIVDVNTKTAKLQRCIMVNVLSKY